MSFCDEDDYDEENSYFYQVDKESEVGSSEHGSFVGAALTMEALHNHNSNRLKRQPEHQQNDFKSLSRKNSSNVDEVMRYKNPNHFQETHYQRENYSTPTSHLKTPSSVKDNRPKSSQFPLQQESFQLQHQYDASQMSYEMLLENTIQRSLDEQHTKDTHNMNAQRTAPIAERAYQRSQLSDSVPRHPPCASRVPSQESRQLDFDCDAQLEEALRRSLISERIDDQARSQHSEFVRSYNQTPRHSQSGGSVRGGGESHYMRGGGGSRDENGVNGGGECYQYGGGHQQQQQVPVSGRCSSHSESASQQAQQCSRDVTPRGCVTSPATNASDGQQQTRAVMTSEQIIAARVRAFNLIGRGGASPAQTPTHSAHPSRQSTPREQQQQQHQLNVDMSYCQTHSQHAQNNNQSHDPNSLDFSPDLSPIPEGSRGGGDSTKQQQSGGEGEGEYFQEEEGEEERDSNRQQYDLRLSVPRSYQQDHRQHQQRQQYFDQDQNYHNDSARYNNNCSQQQQRQEPEQYNQQPHHQHRQDQQQYYDAPPPLPHRGHPYPQQNLDIPSYQQNQNHHQNVSHSQGACNNGHYYKPSPAYSDGHTSVDTSARQSFDCHHRASLPVQLDDVLTVLSSLTPTSQANEEEEVVAVVLKTAAAVSWQCAICTLVNVATYLVCEACGTTKNPLVGQMAC